MPQSLAQYPSVEFDNLEGERYKLSFDRAAEEFVLTGSEVDVAAREGANETFKQEANGDYSLRWPLNADIQTLFRQEPSGEIVFKEVFVIGKDELIEIPRAIAQLAAKS